MEIPQIMPRLLCTPPGRRGHVWNLGQALPLLVEEEQDQDRGELRVLSPLPPAFRPARSQAPESAALPGGTQLGHRASLTCPLLARAPRPASQLSRLDYRQAPLRRRAPLGNSWRHVLDR
jgi:hypothetical protein